MSRGIIAIGIEKDDELVAASCTDGKQIVFLATHDGKAIRFEEDDVRSMGRPAYGVRGMDLDKERLHRRHGGHSEETRKRREQGQRQATARPRDEGRSRRKAGAEPHPDASPSMATASARRWTSIACNRAAARASSTCKTTARNGKVVAILLVTKRLRPC